jgi:hypothetical protein
LAIASPPLLGTIYVPHLEILFSYMYMYHIAHIHVKKKMGVGKLEPLSTALNRGRPLY